ncbi:hypothetical protein GCM10022241_22080 [Micrococcus endophyticus]
MGGDAGADGPVRHLQQDRGARAGEDGGLPGEAGRGHGAGGFTGHASTLAPRAVDGAGRVAVGALFTFRSS